MAQIPVLPQYYVGRGADSATGRPYGEAIDFDSELAVSAADEVSFKFVAISSSRELTEQLNV
jgi:hypothetical protein